MALIKCPECGHENVSDTATSCPNCGFNVRDYTDKINHELEENIASLAGEIRKNENNSLKKNKPFKKIGIIMSLTIAALLIILLVTINANKDYKLSPSEEDAVNCAYTTSIKNDNDISIVNLYEFVTDTKPNLKTSYTNNQIYYVVWYKIDDTSILDLYFDNEFLGSTVDESLIANEILLDFMSNLKSENFIEDVEKEESGIIQFDIEKLKDSLIKKLKEESL